MSQPKPAGAKALALQKPGADKPKRATPHTAAMVRQAMIQRTNEEAFALLAAIEAMDLEPAAEYIRQHRPSDEAIATLAFMYAAFQRKAKGKHAASRPRKPTEETADGRAEASGCVSYLELRRKELGEGRPANPQKDTGWLSADFSKRTLERAFLKLRQKRKQESL